jgi:hypothetical protein
VRDIGHKDTEWWRDKRGRQRKGETLGEKREDKWGTK